MTASVHYIPPILRSTSPAQDELLAYRDELERRIAVLCDAVVEGLAMTDAAKHAGGIDKALARELIEECLNDIMHHAKTAIENDLERLP